MKKEKKERKTGMEKIKEERKKEEGKYRWMNEWMKMSGKIRIQKNSLI